MRRSVINNYIKIALLSLLLLLAANNNTFAAQQETPVSSPQTYEQILQELSQNFCQAYIKKDETALRQLWSNRASTLDNYQSSIKQLFTYPEQIESIVDCLVKTEIKDNDTAIIKVGLIFIAIKPSTNDNNITSTKPQRGKRSFLLECIKEDGYWRISNIKGYMDVMADQLLTMESASARQVLLKQEYDFYTLELARKLYQKAFSYLKNGNNSQASNVLYLALEVTNQRQIDPDYPEFATAIYMGLGVSHNGERKFELALKSLEQALALAKQYNNKATIGKIYTNLGNYYSSQKDYYKTLEYYRESLAIKTELGDEKGIAQLNNNLGIIYQVIGDDQAAYEALQKSLATHEKLRNMEGIATTCNTLGNYLFGHRNDTEAIEIFKKGLSAAQEIKNDSAIALTYHNLAGIYRAQGDFKLALKYYFNSLTILEKLKDIDSLVKAYNGIGIIYQEQGDNLTALKYYQRSLKILGHTVDESEIAFVLHLMGAAYRAMGQNELALSYYCESLALSEKNREQIRIATTLFNMGNTYTVLGHYEQAEKSYRQSLANATTDLPLQTQIWNGLAELYETQNKYEQALEFSQKSIELAHQLNSFDIFWEPRETAARVLFQLNKPDEARKSFQEAISMIEKNRNQVGGAQQDQPNFLAKRVSPYYGMIKLLLNQNNNYEALYYAEMSKSRVLLDVLQGGRINIKKHMTPVQQQEEENLKRAITVCQAKLALVNSNLDKEKNSSNTTRKWQSEQENLQKDLTIARQKLQEFWQNLYAQLPELKHQRAEEQPVNKHDLCNLLSDSNRALLEYVVMDDNCYLFLLTRKKSLKEENNTKNSDDELDLQVYRLDISKNNLIELINKFRTGLITNTKSDYLSIGQLLYQKMIMPAQDRLKDKQELIIVPDNVIWTLPFQALVQKVDQLDHFLIETKAISYSPSLTALKEMIKLSEQHKKKYQNNNLLAFANPMIPEESFVVNNEGDSTTLKDFYPLVEAEQLAKDLTNQYGDNQSKCYIGNNATEKQLKAVINNYKTIIFATHGVFNKADPMSSYLVLSRTGVDDLEDGLLQAREIIEMDLTADMIILSACDTGLGELSIGEGIVGLMWSVFVAGCPTTVVTQWKVKSDSTKDFVLNFYNKLQANPNNSKAEVLRQATIQLIKNKRFSSPYYWAAFSIVGNIDCVITDTSH